MKLSAVSNKITSRILVEFSPDEVNVDVQLEVLQRILAWQNNHCKVRNTFSKCQGAWHFASRFYTPVNYGVGKFVAGPGKGRLVDT